MSIQAIILAAGKSSRFGTDLTKQCHTVCGKPMVIYPLQILEHLIIPTTVVLGHQKEKVLATINDHHLVVDRIEQQEQGGTGHAVAITRTHWVADHIIIAHGDMPLITQETFEQLIAKHTTTHADITFVVAYNPDPSLTGYGRVVQRDNQIRIIEQHEFTGDSSIDCYVNAATYIVKRSFLEESIDHLPERPHRQRYLTDIIAYATEQNKKIETLEISFDQARGINTLKELWVAEQIKRAELIHHWMDRGVRFMAPQTVLIDTDVTIGRNTVIGAGAILRKKSSIGHHCTIGDYSIIEESTLQDHVEVFPHSIISQSHLAHEAKVGPFAHIKQHSHLDTGAHVGNFVEVTRSTIGAKSKAKHLSYLGDAVIGRQTNIGAGTITCNYDGFEKHKTTIHDNVLIGAHTTLIAPVGIGEGAITAAGSVITDDVPNNALAIARERQVIKQGYAQKIKEKKSIRSNKTIQPAANV